MNRLQITCARALCLLLSAFVCAGLLFQPAPTVAQQQQKDKKNKNKKDAPVDTNVPGLMSEEQQIDVQISTMLGGWQISDLEKMHQTYADDVILVSGNWAPPIVGWSNFVTMYQQQRAHMQQVRMDRSNTYIKVKGTFGWACYQWDFSANVDGQPSAARGQTTLVFEKDNGRWLIVHNHTSLVQAAGALAPFRPDGSPSGQQPPQH
jgi:ketosteroid isomerase-like protein